MDPLRNVNPLTTMKHFAVSIGRGIAHMPGQIASAASEVAEYMSCAGCVRRRHDKAPEESPPIPRPPYDAVPTQDREERIAAMYNSELKFPEWRNILFISILI